MKKFEATIKGTYINKEIIASNKVEARRVAETIFSNITVAKVIIIKELAY